MNDQIPMSTADSPEKSKRKLLWALLLVAATAMMLPVVGLYIRRDLLQKAGPVHVEVRNDTEIKYRADLLLGGQMATLEMDAGEHGLVRFNPQEETSLTLRVLRLNQRTNEWVESPIKPNTEQLLVFRIKGDDKLELERSAGSAPVGPQG